MNVCEAFETEIWLSTAPKYDLTVSHGNNNAFSDRTIIHKILVTHGSDPRWGWSDRWNIVGNTLVTF